MSIVIEPNGAQLLPPVEDQRATVTGWQARCARDADLRTRSPLWREVASKLTILPDLPDAERDSA